MEQWSDVAFKPPPLSVRGKLRKYAVALVCLLGSWLFDASRLFKKRRPTVAPKRILLIRRGGLGDILMMTGLLDGLRRGFPSAHIAVLIGRQGVVALEGNPCVDQVLEMPGSRTEWPRVLRTLRAGRFDTAFILHRIFLPSLLAVAAGIPQRFGFYWKRHSFALTSGIQFNPARSQFVQINELTRLVTPIEPPARPQLKLTPTTVEVARQMLASWGYDPGRPLVGIHPGGGETAGSSEPPKRWLPERFGNLADMLAERNLAQILLLQGPGDQPFAAAMLASMRIPPLRVVTDLGFQTLSALVGLCDLAVVNDSGPMHIAWSQGVPVVAVVGPTHPGYTPPCGKQHAVVWAGVPCSPCYQPDELALGRRFHGKKIFECWRGTHECMKAVTVEDVYSAVKARIEALKGLPK